MFIFVDIVKFCHFQVIKVLKESLEHKGFQEETGREDLTVTTYMAFFFLIILIKNHFDLYDLYGLRVM